MEILQQVLQRHWQHIIKRLIPLMLKEGLEQKVIERTHELRMRDEKLRLALTTNLTGTWDWDIEKDEVHCDAAMFTLFGISAETSEDTSPPYSKFLSQLHPDDRALTDKKVWEAVNSGTEFETEFRITWPDNSTQSPPAPTATLLAMPSAAIASHNVFATQIVDATIHNNPADRTSRSLLASNTSSDAGTSGPESSNPPPELGNS
jgi:PAS domain-containing protein